MNQPPILYSFRRCPYAIRARLALGSAGIAVELREVVLKRKPAAMLALSPKGTVPVLQLPDGQVIDESLDIMRWALRQNDPENWLADSAQACEQLVAENDAEFKYWLDRYKYFERYPEQSQLAYRAKAEKFLQHCERCLAENGGMGLLDCRLTLADIAILPFVRQFAHTDIDGFEQMPYPMVRQWLGQFKGSQLFAIVMQKWPEWDATGQDFNHVEWT